jgi:hypothetical protein
MASAGDVAKHEWLVKTGNGVRTKCAAQAIGA